MKITALMDNVASEHKGLISEHGLSYFIDTGKSHIIFDCGGSIHPFENAKKMNISFDKVNDVVFSHGHYDHSAGFREAEHLICPKRVITGKDFFDEKYAYDGTIITYLGNGFGKEFLKEKGIKHIVCEKEFQIDDNCFVISDFERIIPFEKIPERFFILKEEKLIRDDFHDEVCLVIKSKKGLIVVLGCSHPGLLNMLRRIHTFFDQNIYAVFGGTHLVEADEKRIRVSLEEMKTLGIEVLCMSHCSGNKAIDIAREFQGITSVPLSVGSTFII